MGVSGPLAFVWESLPRFTTTVYTRYIQRVTTRAKLFQNGGSQAVRLPQSFRFPEDATEVLVRREGRCIILEPVDEWSDDFRARGCLDREPPPPVAPVSEARSISMTIS
jgi:virulence-associated protein VagC